MALHTTYDGDGCCNSFPFPVYTDVRDQTRSFSGVAAFYELLPASIGGKGEPERVWANPPPPTTSMSPRSACTSAAASWPAKNALPVIVLSHRLWQRRFASDPAILGKAVPLSGHMFTVVDRAPRLSRSRPDTRS